ncbi:putative efflux system component YknX [Pelotomaculum schinkii]|uniref:Putative efflux system component YknX n=1 Tax=Pelotomaculum schinkii TaxID=78350 RepID=A0A4Y7R5P3_9FIRM|nr:efflux RND transporter periplasmic adaptor subunit [Pelotomaculum schinkii]TEB04066.1 putative efflux system component YknX [Pelotomaculum schinkii]
MKRKRRIYVWGGIALAVLTVAAQLLMRGGQEVAAVKVQTGSVNRTVTDSGYVQPASDFNIHATQTARVTQVVAEAGQPVKQGETLVVLENLDLSLQISDTQSQIAQAGSTAAGARAAVERLNLELKDASDNLDRVQELFKGGAVSRADYDKAVLLVETCRQNLNEQSSKLDSALAQEAGLRQTLSQLSAKEGQLVVKSPTDGMVLNLPVKQEEVVSSGALLAVLAAAGQLEVKADILSDDLGEVRVGQKVSITAPVLGGKKLAGEVKKIYPSAEEKESALGVIQRRVPVIITLPDPDVLKPGYEVRVAIETLTREDVLVLPREAVRTTGDGHKEVMVVTQGQVQRRTVQTGLSDQENIEITGGLESGEMIVRDGGLDLKEKAKVKPVEKS